MKKRNFVSCCLTLAIWTAASQCAAANAIQPFSLDKARVAANRLEIKLPNSEKLAFDVKSSTRAGITTVTGQQGDNSLLITTDGRNTFGLITTAQTTYKIDTREQGVFLYDEREFYSKPIDGIASNFAEAQVSRETRLQKSKFNFTSGRQRDQGHRGSCHPNRRRSSPRSQSRRRRRGNRPNQGRNIWRRRLRTSGYHVPGSTECWCRPLPVLRVFPQLP